MAVTPEFPLSCQQTRKKIREYRQKVECGEFEKADFWHLISGTETVLFWLMLIYQD